MLKAIRVLIILLSTMYLSACMIDGTSSYSNFNGYNNLYNYSNEPMIYPDSYDTYRAYNQNYNSSPPPAASKETVVVPNSYHVGAGNPTSSKDVDKRWVNSQNPQSYTIELTNDNKASKVAGVLYKAPKNERTAEVKTNKGGYKGLYGSYPTYEAAKEKLNSLPEDIKNNANIKAWGNVQNDISE